MSNKTYAQYCAIAIALDMVGERWTLLIVRNLLLGPKRFSDLMKGLPGISTNILTERLKLLEEQGIATTRFLPPPAASTVYQLTEEGFSLADVLSALARWGSAKMGKPQPDQTIVPEGIGFMVIGVFRRNDNPEVAINCNFHVQDDGYDHTFGIGLSPRGVTLTNEALPSPDTTMRMGLEMLPALSSGRVQLAVLIEDQTVEMKGDEAALRALVSWVDTR